MDSSECASRLEKGERGAAELQANIAMPWPPAELTSGALKF